MLILGLIDSKPSAAALLEDGRPRAAIAEERLCRMKMASGMPREAISEVMRQANVSAKELDAVAVAQRVSVFEPKPIPWSGWFDESGSGDGPWLDRLGSGLAPLLGRSPLAWRAHHRLKGVLSRSRLTKIPQLLRQEYGITAPVRFLDHHDCHAATAYFASGFDRTLVVTLDGGGDGRSGSIHVGEGGDLATLSSIDSFNSLGNLYSYVTELCGFRAEKHEGKITGLAALGEPAYAHILRRFVRYQEPGAIRYTVPMYHQSALRLLRRELPPSFDRAALAASVQLILEEIAVAVVRYWLRRTGCRRLALAGGVFGNVKLNQRLHELDEVDEIFIFPAMDDAGLAVGSALALEAEEARRTGSPCLPEALPHVYLGSACSDAEIEAALRESGLSFQRIANVHETIAQLLAGGSVVARFAGRMEFGPRALGHRSIMYQTNDASVNDWLNQKLDRTEFMPFAPATLAEHADACYLGLKGAEHAARFMTLTFSCSNRMRRDSPGPVHVDGTARPQIVDRETAPDFHQILSAYERITGIPSLINTSFNIHEEPIVCSPRDALRAFEQGGLDYLAIENWLVKGGPRASGSSESAVEADS